MARVAKRRVHLISTEGKSKDELKAEARAAMASILSPPTTTYPQWVSLN